MGVTDASDSRLDVLTRWVTEELGFAGGRIEPASADASFRRYFRLTRAADSYIVMDAPPDKEDTLEAFVGVARSLLGMGLNVPVVLARDLRRGLLLLSDLGTRQYLEQLTAGRDVDRLYGDALAALAKMQTRGAEAARSLPPYDRGLLHREMELMPEWFLARHLEAPAERGTRAMLDRLFEFLAQSALAQPATFVHRDYHSRNLLVTDQGNPGVLDFQDAVRGAVTYDAVSLLKDCYIAWPVPRVHGWLLEYRRLLIDGGLRITAGEGEFIRWFDLMGLQRHIKVLGIFARLFYRDGKPGYLKDLPRVLEYAREAAALYPQTAEFADFIGAHVAPNFPAAQSRAMARAVSERTGRERGAVERHSEAPLAAMILAAGRGERMRPLTDRVPKPLLTVRGKPLIEYHLDRLALAGIDRIVVNLAWLGATIRDALGDGARFGVRIHYSEEAPRALETGGGIFRALPILGSGPFLVVNGDVFTDYPLEDARLALDRDAHLVLVPNPPQHPEGDFGLAQGVALPGAAVQYTFAGIAVYRRELFAHCADGAFPLKPLLLRSMAAGRCSAELFQGLWQDVGTIDRLAALNAAGGVP